MQNRMKKYPLDNEQISELLDTEQVGRITTINASGYPYTVPVHFIVIGEFIYIHGLSKGQKIDNLKTNEKVCFEADNMQGIIYDAPQNACEVNTAYKSVIVLGDAGMIEDIQLKKDVLKEMMHKYAPDIADLPMPDNAVKATGIIRITMNEVTGKYYA